MHEPSIPFNYSGKLEFMIRATRDRAVLRTDLAVLGCILDHADKHSGKAYPSLRTIISQTGVPKTTASRSIRRLEDSGWLTAERRFGGQTIYYLTMPDDGTGPDDGASTTWNPTGSAVGLRTGPVHGNGPAPSTEHEQEGKRTGIKNRGKTSVETVDLPHWLPKQLWADFKQARKQAKAPLTKKAEELTIKKLDTLRKAGHEPAAVLEQSIINGWKGIFEVKGGASKVTRISREAMTDEEIEEHNAAELRVAEARGWNS